MPRCVAQILDKLSVLVFNATHPTSTGGVRRFSEELIRCIRSRECTVYQLFGTKENGLVSGFIILLSDFIDVLKNVEVVHFIVLSPFNIPFMILAKLYRKKIVTSYHGIYTAEASAARRLHTLLSHWAADRISRVLSDAIVSSSIYLNCALKLSEKVVVIRYPSEQHLQTFAKKNMSRTKSEIRFVTASNFNIDKKSEALHVLIKAMEYLVKDYGFVRLSIFGGGKGLATFKSKYKDIPYISFLGFRTDFQDILAASDGYIHMSGLDNQPYSIIDALMMGKIIVCNNLEPLVEMISPDNNYVVPLQPIAVKRALDSLTNELLHNPRTIEARGEQNKSFANQRHSSEIVSREYLKLYSQILNSPGTGL